MYIAVHIIVFCNRQAAITSAKYYIKHVLMNIMLLASEIAEHEILFRKIQNATAAIMGLSVRRVHYKKVRLSVLCAFRINSASCIVSLYLLISCIRTLPDFGF